MYARPHASVLQCAKSSDNGQTWSPLNSGLSGPYVQSLAIDPIAPQTVYAGTDFDGVFKSINGANNWTSVNSGLVSSNIQALIADPIHSGTVYLAYGGGQAAVLAKTVDGGQNWVSINSGLTSAWTILPLAIDPANSSILFAGTLGTGVFKSTDGGQNWRPAGGTN